MEESRVVRLLGNDDDDDDVCMRLGEGQQFERLACGPPKQATDDKEGRSTRRRLQDMGTDLEHCDGGGGDLVPRGGATGRNVWWDSRPRRRRLSLRGLAV
jgi:hypothetical protein